jgi:hypothetical protein
MSKLTEQMHEDLGIFNPWLMARRYEAPAWIIFRKKHASLIGWADRRAVAYAGEEEREFRADGRTMSECRVNSVNAAREWVAEKVGSDIEWVKGPYPDTWFPKEVHDALKADLKAARK